MQAGGDKGERGLATYSSERVQHSVSAPVAGPSTTSGGVVGGVVGGVPGREQQESITDGPQIVRTAALRILTARPGDTVEQVAALALRYAGTVQNSAVSGTERSQWAQVTLHVPPAHFDEVRRQIRKLASSVEQERTEAQDVTRRLTDEEAKLRNLHAEEAQYLGILKRADKVKDIVAVTEKLSDVRGEIERIDAERRYLAGQVAMAAITVTIGTVAEAEVLGVHWHPLYQAKLAVLSVLSGFAEYADAMVQLIVHLPLIAVWAATVLLIARAGWAVLRRALRLVFPRKPQESIAQT
jgi:Domain of unknown function (DUF4349)